MVSSRPFMNVLIKYRDSVRKPGHHEIVHEYMQTHLRTLMHIYYILKAT